MKNKKIVRIALIIFIMFMFIIISNYVCIAADNFDFSGFEKKADSTITDPVKTGIGSVLSVVRIAGTGIAIIILAYMGIKYMIAAPGDRADFKKGAMQYVVGAIIVFGAANLLGMLIPIFETIMPS
ncbi:MAG: TrbC/VirB2 family protein [Clostridia bacterium]